MDGVDSDEEDEPKVQPARDTVKRRGERKKSSNVDPEDKMVFIFNSSSDSLCRTLLCAEGLKFFSSVNWNLF